MSHHDVRLFAVVAVAFGASGDLHAAGGAAVVRNALETSARSGRPMLVTVGRETCVFCKQLDKQLRTEAPVTKLASQFVNLHVDLDDADQQRAWFEKYKAAGSGIPMVYVVRADGKLMHSQSGAAEGLAEFLLDQLKQCGRQLNAQQIAQLAKALEAAKGLFAEGRDALAVSKLEKFVQMGSYQEPAVEAAKLVEEVVVKVKDRIRAADEKLAKSEEADRLDGAAELVAVARNYARIAELKKLVNQSLTKARKNPSLKDSVRQAEMLDSAAEAAKKDASKAASAYEKLIGAFPETLAAKRAEEARKSLKDGEKDG